MWTINFARTCGLTYVHTPFDRIGHADRPMREWIDAWEAHFNLGMGEVTARGDNRGIVNLWDGIWDLLPLFGVSIYDLTRAFDATIPEFRRKYYSNKSPRRNEVLIVGVHVRRGDITSSRPDRWTSTSLVAETVAKVRAVLDAHFTKYKICVFSEGDNADFAKLEAPGTEFFLDADPIWSMQEFIEADILIMSKSSFSYVSALISDGIKIYEPLEGYPPMSSWVMSDHDERWLRYGPNGDFDCAAFERQLLRHIEFRKSRSNIPPTTQRVSPNPI